MGEPTVSSISLRNLVEQIAKIAEGHRSISNRELIEICKSHGVFDSNVDSHFCHEIAEAAINLLVAERYGPDLLAATDPVKAVSAILRPLQKRLPTQTWRSETQITYQQFSTPVQIAYLAAYLLKISRDETVLEPSCGTGSLAVWAIAAGATVITNEIDTRRRELARYLGLEPHAVDAEFIDDLLPYDLIPDVVMANPPFSSTGGRLKQNSIEYGFRQIESSLRRLRNGGRFAVILGENGSTSSRAGSRFWKSLYPGIQVKVSIELPGQEFYCNGTSVKTTLIIGSKSSAVEPVTSANLEIVPHIVALSVEDAFEQVLTLGLCF